MAVTVIVRGGKTTRSRFLLPFGLKSSLIPTPRSFLVRQAKHLLTSAEDEVASIGVANINKPPTALPGLPKSNRMTAKYNHEWLATHETGSERLAAMTSHSRRLTPGMRSSTWYIYVECGTSTSARLARRSGGRYTLAGKTPRVRLSTETKGMNCSYLSYFDLLYVVSGHVLMVLSETC